MADYGKQYLTEDEFTKRFKIFQESLRVIEQHDQKERGYEIGLDSFSDWSYQEKQ